jgi:hypothetical protein
LCIGAKNILELRVAPQHTSFGGGPTVYGDNLANVTATMNKLGWPAGVGD